jgi:hypothetical protein
MSTPEYLLSFNHHNREIFRITHDARMICSKGLSTEEATQEVAKLLIASFEEQIQKMVDNRLAADTARLDWLQSSVNLHVNSIALSGDNIRDAIDKAMKEASK